MQTTGGYTGYEVTGSKYERGLSAVEIAKRVRRDIAAAVKAGDLPGKAAGFKYSVRSERFSGGQAINVNIVGPGDDDWAYRPVTDSQQDAKAFRYGMTRVYTDEAERIGALIRSLVTDYTRNDSDAQIDYFDVSCYVSVYAGSGGSVLA